MNVSSEHLQSIVDAERWSELAEVVDLSYFALALTHPAAITAALQAAPADWLQDNPRYLMAREVARSHATPAGLVDETVVGQFARWVAATPSPATRDILAIQTTEIRFLVAMGRFDDAADAADLAETLIDTATSTSGFRDVVPIILIVAGTAKLLAAETLAATSSFAEASRWASDNSEHPVWRHAEDYLAPAPAVSGRYSEAAKHLQHDPAEETSAPDTLAARYAPAGILAAASIAVGTMDREGSAAAIEALSEGTTSKELWWIVLHLRARHALHQGGRTAAVDALEAALVQLRTLAGPRSLAGMTIRADLADLYLAEGEHSAASHVLTHPDVDPTTWCSSLPGPGSTCCSAATTTSSPGSPRPRRCPPGSVPPVRPCSPSGPPRSWAWARRRSPGPPSPRRPTPCAARGAPRGGGGTP